MNMKKHKLSWMIIEAIVMLTVLGITFLFVVGLYAIMGGK